MPRRRMQTSSLAWTASRCACVDVPLRTAVIVPTVTTRRVRRAIYCAVSFVALLVLAGCTTTALQEVIDDTDQKFAPASRFPGFGVGDSMARAPAPSRGYGPVSDGTTKPGQVFSGTAPDRVSSTAATGSTETAAAGGAIIPSNDGRSYQLNFEATDVAAVGKAILGDILNANYLIDSRVSGQINLTSSQAVPRSSLIPLLETALLSINATLSRDGTIYRISPVAEPRSLGNIGFQAATDGYGTTVIPARYVPAANLAKILDGLGGRSGTVKVEPTSNLLMIQGTAAERRALLGAAAMVDVDWMRTKSVAILPIEHAAPETVIAELNKILGTGEGGLSQNVVVLQPISRLNAVLAVSSRRDAIDHVTKWVLRLDAADDNAAGVKVYRLKYAQAKTVAATLNRMFGVRTGGTGQADADQLEPGQDNTDGTNGEKVATAQPATTSGSTAPTPASNAGGVSSTNLVKTSFGADSSAGQKPTGADDATSTDSRSGRSGKVRVTPDVTNNVLFVETTPQTYAVVERAIREMDRFPTQVNIEVTIAEITLTSELQYGVQFFLKSGNFSAGLGGASGIPLRTSYPGLNLVSGALLDPQVVLDALAQFTSVKVLSSPSLVVLDRQPAVLQVGDQIPILTRQLTSAESTATVSNVDLKDTGIILNVLPRVNANGLVTLNVEQQISNVVSTQPDTLTPTISQRRVKSVISVSSGQTVLLAGLITDGQNINRNGLPVVSQIKVLSDLLSSHDRTASRTELIIFIRPKIIASGQDAQHVTEEFLGRMRSITSGAGGIVSSKY
uniref:General secretion pathway protein D n=1 Tax=Rhodopseudomonas palustris (strain BisA53) TaxID=316055 RepID=Q07N78_RHOP5